MISLAEWVEDLLTPDLRHYKVGEIVPFHCFSKDRSIRILEFRDNCVMIEPTAGTQVYYGPYKMNFDGVWCIDVDKDWYIDWENPR